MTRDQILAAANLFAVGHTLEAIARVIHVPPEVIASHFEIIRQQANLQRARAS